MPLRSLLESWSGLRSVSKQLKWLYISVVLRRVAESFLVVVGPVFLFNLAGQLPIIGQVFQDEFRSGLLAVVIFYLLKRLGVLLLAPLVAKSSISKNPKLSLIIGQSVLMLAIISYTFIQDNIWLFFVIPLLSALNLLWYWTNYYVILASEVEPKHIGQEMGVLEVLVKLMGLLGPLLGTFLAVSVSFASVFWTASFFLLLSILTLVELPNLRLKTVWRWSDFKLAAANSVGRRQLLGLGGYHWENPGLLVFWPVLLFWFFNNIVAAGYILASAGFVSLILAYLSGLAFDNKRQNNRWNLNTGGTRAILWLVRALAWHSPLILVAIESLDRLVSGFFDTTFLSLTILRVRANNSIIYAYNRQIAFAIANIIGSGLIVLILLLDLHLIWLLTTFFLAGSLTLIFVKDQRLRYVLAK